MTRLRSLYLLSIPVLLLGVLLLLFGLLSAFVLHDNVHWPFFQVAGVTLVAGTLGLFGIPANIRNIGPQESLLFVTLTWVLTGLLGGLPFMLINRVSFTDATFEAIAGITTTGATILTGLDAMPRTLLLYRQFLQWVGGLGVIILVVAIMPMLNIGGMRLYKAEFPGPLKGDKLAPRISHTARYMWYVYLLLTLACAFCFWLAGMDVFDAIAHSLSTVATGGFSTHDASIGHFNSPAIEAVACIFMLLGAINFGLHFVVLSGRSPMKYLRDEETRWFLAIIVGTSLLLALGLWWANTIPDPQTSLRQAFFHVISFVTSTGYSAGNYAVWPGASAVMLIMLAYVGGCAGSTTGGNKVVRNALTIKAILQEIKYLIHPRGVFSLKFNRRPVSRDVMDSVKGYMFIAAAFTIILTLLLMTTGLDFLSALSAVTACINVNGPAFGILSSNYIPISDAGTWLLSFTMILGRLEFFTLLALLHPAFWRR